jgi:capsule polysaccharide export protein KpsE/RkpR
MTARRDFIIGAIATLAILATLGAQAVPQRAVAPTDPTARELHDLRLSIDRASADSVHSSILLARIGAAQNRLTSLSAELASLRLELARNSGEIARNGAIMRDVEASYPPDWAPNKGAMIGPYGDARRQVEAANQVEQNLRTREAELATLVGREQAQVNQLLAKLDALEQSLNERR